MRWPAPRGQHGRRTRQRMQDQTHVHLTASGREWARQCAHAARRAMDPCRPTSRSPRLRRVERMRSIPFRWTQVCLPAVTACARCSVVAVERRLAIFSQDPCRLWRALRFGPGSREITFCEDAVIVGAAGKGVRRGGACRSGLAPPAAAYARSDALCRTGSGKLEVASASNCAQRTTPAGPGSSHFGQV